jgi:hypothetical protein
MNWDAEKYRIAMAQQTLAPNGGAIDEDRKSLRRI